MEGKQNLMKSLESEKCLCIKNTIDKTMEKLMNDQRISNENFILQLNGESKIDHEAQNRAITEVWREIKHNLMNDLLNIEHSSECEFIKNVNSDLASTNIAITHDLDIPKKEFFEAEIKKRKLGIITSLENPAFNKVMVTAYCATIYYYTKLIELHDGKMSPQPVQSSQSGIDQNNLIKVKPKGLTWYAIGYFLFLMKSENDIDITKYVNETFPKYFDFEISDLARQYCTNPGSAGRKKRMVEIEKYVYPYLSNNLKTVVSERNDNRKY